MTSIPTGADLNVVLTALSARLRARGFKLATAESCTGGWIAKVITDIPGASDWFDCAIVSYSNASKQRLLGVPLDIIEQHGAVSEHTVRAMLQGLFERCDADVGIAVSGIAGPGGGAPDKPVGTVWFAFGLRASQHSTQLLNLAGNRRAVRAQAVKIALESACTLIK